MNGSGLALTGYDLGCVPAVVLNYPSMMGRREKGMLYWLARNVYKGDGVIVDAGLFLGASTNAFAKGILDGASRNAAGTFKPIHSYDTAVWVNSMNRHLRSPVVQQAIGNHRPRSGQSFLPLLKRLLSAHLNLIDFRIGDIVQTAGVDRPIEIAFYDCLKTAERDAAAFRAFAPWYVPGTIVVQQDYFYESAPDLKIRQEYLSPYFSYVGTEATSAVFRVERPLPQSFLVEDPVAKLTTEEKITLLSQAAERATDPKFRVYTLLSIVTFLADIGNRDAAHAQLDSVLAMVDSER